MAVVEAADEAAIAVGVVEEGAVGGGGKRSEEVIYVLEWVAGRGAEVGGGGRGVRGEGRRGQPT